MMDAAAGEDQRAPGAGEQRGGAGDVGMVGPDAAGGGLQGRRVDREIFRAELMLAVADILGHIEQDRPRPA